jgi:hypothetical protein
VRVFLKAPKGGKRKLAITSSIEALTPLADYAKEKGVIIVIEPGASTWARNGHFLAAVARTMNHPACRLMPDFGKLSDPYCGTVAMMPYSESVSAKSWGFDEKGDEKSLSYFRLIRSINDVEYKKIISIEYEGEKLGPVEGVKATQKLLQKFQGDQARDSNCSRKLKLPKACILFLGKDLFPSILSCFNIFKTILRKIPRFCAALFALV